MRDVQPQPAFRELSAGALPSPVLDIGTGEGDLALHIAAMGRDVLGVDIDPRVVAAARARARALGSTARFREHDVFELPLLSRRFACVVDSGLLHTLDAAPQARVLLAVAAVLEARGTYHVLGFADRLPAKELARLAGRDFRVESARSARYVLPHGPAVPAVLVTLRRLG